MELRKIAERFGLAGISDISEVRSGHINKTCRVTCSSGQYILQSLNRTIFPEPEIIMRNISRIEEAFRGEEIIAIPHYLSCGDQNYAELDGEIWRIYPYIEEYPQNEGINRAHGYAVGRFLKIVNSCDIEFETPVKLHRFEMSLPLRNIHGDTKADNIISGRRTTVIDFDTAMRGYICADYGDMIRSVTTKVFDMQTVQEITEGFAEGLDGLITAAEVGSLYSGIVLIIRELAVRYHGGNKNFPNKTADECLERERELTVQLENFCKYRNDIQTIINTCFA
ncbi:MAG: aminoglycoside phosphotransferase family protein [Alistipes sp.]|nr:aminoglycoside phosphotransferase family protein [Alistipes sp.]